MECLINHGKVDGVNGNLAFYNIGVIYECLGQLEDAEKFYLKCEKYKLADDAIRRIRKIDVD